MPQDILNHFLDRHKFIESRLSGKKIKFDNTDPINPQLIDLCTPSKQLLNTALDIDDGNFSSWMPGLPLAALLASRRRLTVDIAPHFLGNNFRRSYGISEKALIAFARKKMLLLNIRDFDPLAPEEEQRKCAEQYSPFKRLIEKIFDQAPDSVYFLASLRHRMFDAISNAKGGRRTSLRRLFDESSAISSAAQAAAELPTNDYAVLSQMFRGERTPEIATRWHWAYVNSVSHFIEPEVFGEVKRQFEKLTEPHSDSFVTGTAYLNLQNRLRYLHLIHSAPLSASFGGPYGFSLENELTFIQAVERGEHALFDYDYMPDRLMDLLYDLQLGKIRDEFKRLISDRHWEIIKPIATRSYCRVGPETYFDHYDEEENIGELIGYFEEGANTAATYKGLEDEMDGLLGRTDDLEPKSLLDIGHAAQEAQLIQNNELSRLTEGKQIVSAPSPPLLTEHQSVVNETIMKGLNLIYGVLGNLGLNIGNTRPAIGGAGDFPRRGWHTFQMFRGPPS